MLQKAMQDLRSDAIVARDGSIGSVKDIYFDDEHWAVRYLVVDTGNWLSGREVLISPVSVDSDGSSGDAIQVGLTRSDIERAPGVEAHAPVSRLYEEAHARHYGHPFYWSGPYVWGPAPMPLAIPPTKGAQQKLEERERERSKVEERADKSHLRSGAEVVGYRIHAADGTIGHVEDFLVDDATWRITNMVVDTRSWLPGKKVLVDPGDIETIDWHAREVRLRLSKAQLKAAPAAP